MGLLNSRWFQRLGGGFLERMAINSLSWVQLQFLTGHKDKQDVRLIRRVRRERQSLLTAFESFVLHSIARAYRNMPGQMAEVGVYRGGSAKLLCEAKGDKELHLFDTFMGLPESGQSDGNVHRPGQYTCSLESVKQYLAQYSNVFFHKGLFPDSAAPVADSRFCFVHMDVDLYESTRACLEFFYPRMLPGGLMISHDYSILLGVKKAFQEFFAGRAEGIIELPTTQCIVIKGQ